VIYLLAGFQFLAVTQVLVYAGAIMVLFLFVIMLLNLADESALAPPLRALRRGRLALASLAAGALALVGLLAPGFGQGRLAAPAGDAAGQHGIDRLQPLAEALFSRFVLPFEASSLLLLATMVAVIALAKRQRGGTRDRSQGGEVGP
jgi:NADH-quinone oxidoreductase subunit J